MRQDKIEKLRLGELKQLIPRMSGTGYGTNRGDIPDGWLVGSRSGGWSRGGRDDGTTPRFTTRSMPWEKQPAVEEHTEIRRTGEDREFREARNRTKGFDYAAMLDEARLQVTCTPRSKSATGMVVPPKGVASPPACRVRDRKSFNASKQVAFGRASNTKSKLSPRFPTPKHNGMDPADLPGPGSADPESLKRVDRENWRGHMSDSQRQGNASPWSASRSPKAATLDYAASYKDNCTLLLVSNFGGQNVTFEGRNLDVREELRSCFSQFGRVRAVRAQKGWKSALIEYDVHEDARTALKCMRGLDRRPRWAKDMEVAYFKPGVQAY